MPTPAPDGRTHPGEQLGRVARFVAFQARLWRYCARRLYENNLTAMSAALSFQTIFALIPILVLALVAATAFGFLEDSQRSLRELLQATGFSQIVAVQPSATSEAVVATEPTEGAGSQKVINVADEVAQMVEQVRSQLTFKRVGPIGAALFIWTALGLLSTIESSLNRVFGAAKSRSVPRRVLLYWSTMTLGPALLAIAVYSGRAAITICQDIPVLCSLITVLGRVGPVLVGIAVLAAIYIFVPNATVHRRAALGGALVAVLLWLIAKWGFAIYVERLVLKGSLYGILGAFPLFMLWLNLSWTLFLFGAELTRAAANLGRLRQLDAGEADSLTPLHALTAAVAVARAYEGGKGPVPADQIGEQLGLTADARRALFDKLVASNLLCAVHDGAAERYVLSRPPALVPIAEVLQASAPGPTPAALTGAVQLTLADVLRREEGAGPS